MNRLIVLCWLFVVPAGHAQHVYKCTSGLSVSYQSQPCSGTTEATWHAPPATIDPAIEQHNQAVRQEMDRRRAATAPTRKRAVSRPAGAAIGIARDQSACDRARAARTAAYARLGTRRTFEQSRLWDNRVFDACR